MVLKRSKRLKQVRQQNAYPSYSWLIWGVSWNYLQHPVLLYPPDIWKTPLKPQLKTSFAFLIVYTQLKCC